MQTDPTIKGTCAMQIDPYIRCYKNVLDENVCASMIRTYERLWQEQEEYIRKMSLCYAEDGRKLCGACDCQRLDIMQHSEFKSPINYVMGKLLQTIKQYAIDVELAPNQWPDQYGFENVRIKRYLGDQKQQHDYHSDVNDVSSAKRFLAVVCYLNDDFSGGETYFPKYKIKTEVETGTVVLFPATWNYLHKGNPVTDGHAKYILGTFTNYVKKQKLNRVGDKTLGVERL